MRGPIDTKAVHVDRMAAANAGCWMRTMIPRMALPMKSFAALLMLSLASALAAGTPAHSEEGPPRGHIR